jgi:hypothetical protein
MRVGVYLAASFWDIATNIIIYAEGISIVMLVVLVADLTARLLRLVSACRAVQRERDEVKRELAAVTRITRIRRETAQRMTKASWRA